MLTFNICTDIIYFYCSDRSTVNKIPGGLPLYYLNKSKNKKQSNAQIQLFTQFLITFQIPNDKGLAVSMQIVQKFSAVWLQTIRLFKLITLQ
jgi:hypothetical protein